MGSGNCGVVIQIIDYLPRSVGPHLFVGTVHVVFPEAGISVRPLAASPRFSWWVGQDNLQMTAADCLPVQGVDRTVGRLCVGVFDISKLFTWKHKQHDDDDSAKNDNQSFVLSGNTGINLMQQKNKFKAAKGRKFILIM